MPVIQLIILGWPSTSCASRAARPLAPRNASARRQPPDPNGLAPAWDENADPGAASGRLSSRARGPPAFGFWFSPTFSTSLPIVERLYIAHVVILPALGTLLLIAHFLLVKRHGISARRADFDATIDGGPPPATTGSTFIVHLAKMTGFGLLILAVTVVLSLVVRIRRRSTTRLPRASGPWAASSATT